VLVHRTRAANLAFHGDDRSDRECGRGSERLAAALEGLPIKVTFLDADAKGAQGLDGAIAADAREDWA
jgi:hypothetical protein